MGKYRAVPQGYMLVGEIAKKMGLPVSTLHYYDKKGVLPPTSESEGGRRLYTHKDMVKLLQIQSMKHLGFSLEEIKTRLPSIDTPAEASNILNKQASEIREKIASLQGSLRTIETLSAEVLQMETVDWEKCADIITLLQAQSGSYWMMKHFNNNMINHIRNSFDKKSGDHILDTFKQLNKRVAELKKSGVLPQSEQGQVLAKDWWDMVMDFTGGDISLLPELSKLAYTLRDGEEKDKFEFDFEFVDEAVTAYYTNLGHSPFKE